ncbi:hypothetical protein PG996_007469 [Apiospora saccharicola]|uniref:Uncharacterized protein n=1 Tax=Apiospora saccharicola TaxID=335842 RepID=A0ABR1VAX3_9PEZI
MVLAGCTSSNSLTNIYIISFSYSSNRLGEISDPLLFNPRVAQCLSHQIQGSNDTIQAVRVGYISSCIASSSGVWFCDGKADSLAMQLRLSGSSDPLNLAQLGDSVRREVLFFPLIIIAVALILIVTLLLSVFPRWSQDVDIGRPERDSEREIKFLPFRPTSYGVCALLFAAGCLGFTSAFWQHLGSACSAAMIETMHSGLVESTVGTLAMTFAWLGFLFTVIPMMGFLITVLAIRVFSMLAE